MSTQRLARLASIVFHPAVVMVGAAVVATGAAEGGARLRWQALGLTLAAAVVVMGYSAWQTRSGRWTHIDASERHERAQPNRFASWLLLGIAAILAVLGSHRGIVAANIANATCREALSHPRNRWPASTIKPDRPIAASMPRCDPSTATIAAMPNNSHEAKRLSCARSCRSDASICVQRPDRVCQAL